MNAIVPFNFGDVPIRVEDRDGAPWFVLADVCRVLGIGNPSDAAGRLDDDERDALDITDPIGRPQTATIVNESGLWSLVLTSRKPAAKAFKRWVTGEVLPAIRRTGSCAAPAVAVLPRDPRELLAYLTRQAEDMVELQDARDALAPKADALDRLTDTRGALGIREAAKALKLGQQELVEWLTGNAWAYRSTATGRLQGYRTREQAGLVEHKTTRIPRADGSDKVATALQITAKGLAAIAEALGSRQ